MYAPFTTAQMHLSALDVLHTVGPRGEMEDILESAYKTVLEYAGKHGIRTIVRPLPYLVRF